MPPTRNPHPPTPKTLPLPPTQCYPGDGPALLSPVLQRLLGCCLLPPGSASESGQVVAAALGVLARVLLQNGAAFLQFFEAAAAAQQPGAGPGACGFGWWAGG